MFSPNRDDPQGAAHEAEIMRLLTAHQGVIYAYILSVHPNRVAAQDILQETNIVLWKKRDLFEPGTHFKAWAIRFAHFQTLAYLKRVKNQSWMVFNESLMETIGGEAGEVLEDFDKRGEALRKCLVKLGTVEQDMIRSHYQSGLPLSSLAERLGRSRAAIKQALLRIRRNLKICIERQLRADPGKA